MKTSGRKWLARGFLLWAAVSSLWLANSFRTQGVAERALLSDAKTVVSQADAYLALSPKAEGRAPALLFFCGSGVAAEAYVPLLRPVAESGYPVYIIRLPYRFAPLESNKAEALERARGLMAAHPEVARWVLSGHSLGGALAARFVGNEGHGAAALVLVGTTHPKERSLAALGIPVTKVYGTNDHVAPVDRVLANKALLPPQTEWIAIEGGNHSQFGHYGHQLFDGTATISRELQQERTRDALLKALARQPQAPAGL
ncbi:alpha/beta hydrolase [Pseudoduganella namucuonensis]|uniref:Alpha/beta hydrolase family protein n=1 Tax=Pseudoduganella namucuonensis TaxID=1035707 RepID=A0A1I7EUE3_9BURK|nr:alpha/beta hydrolase [Pseudoduganella namucuonensis]SFU27554.1 Alpha/beta hydrolase family protein [Pseudoduganella namucuonensis]